MTASLHVVRDDRQKLISLYREAASVAFGWVETLRRGLAEPASLTKTGELNSKEDAEQWLNRYMGGMPTMGFLAQRPGDPAHLIGLAFNNPTQSADEWERWAYRLTAAHDSLVKFIEEHPV